MCGGGASLNGLVNGHYFDFYTRIFWRFVAHTMAAHAIDQRALSEELHCNHHRVITFDFSSKYF